MHILPYIAIAGSRGKGVELYIICELSSSSKLNHIKLGFKHVMVVPSSEDTTNYYSILTLCMVLAM